MGTENGCLILLSPFAVSFTLQKSAIDIHQSSIRPAFVTEKGEGSRIDIFLIFIHYNASCSSLAHRSINIVDTLHRTFPR